MTIAHVYIKH